MTSRRQFLRTAIAAAAAPMVKPTLIDPLEQAIAHARQLMPAAAGWTLDTKRFNAYQRHLLELLATNIGLPTRYLDVDPPNLNAR